MKISRSVIWLALVLVTALPSSRVFAEDGAPTGTVTVNTQTDGKTSLTLNNPDWQTVVDSLFGTLENDGLLEGKGPFQLRAEGITLTSTQAEFFTAIDSPQSLSALIEAAESLRGNIRMEGTIDGEPFELKLAGRELKIEGLNLTEAQREALVAELSGISGLKEMKIQAVVDGRMTVTKYQGGHEKLEIRDRVRPNRERLDRPQKPEIARERVERPARMEKTERPERAGRR